MMARKTSAATGRRVRAAAQVVDDPDDPTVGTLHNVIISARGCDGLTVTTVDGHAVTLAAVDQDGRVIESGPAVANEAWSVAIRAYRHFLKGEGCLTVYASPDGLMDPASSDA